MPAEQYRIRIDRWLTRISYVCVRCTPVTPAMFSFWFAAHNVWLHLICFSVSVCSLAPVQHWNIDYFSLYRYCWMPLQHIHAKHSTLINWNKLILIGSKHGRDVRIAVVVVVDVGVISKAHSHCQYYRVDWHKIVVQKIGFTLLNLFRTRAHSFLWFSFNDAQLLRIISMLHRDPRTAITIILCALFEFLSYLVVFSFSFSAMPMPMPMQSAVKFQHLCMFVRCKVSNISTESIRNRCLPTANRLINQIIASHYFVQIDWFATIQTEI